MTKQLAEIIDDLKKIFGNTAVDNAENLKVYGSVFTWHQSQSPLIVIYPESTEDVSLLLGYCSSNGVAVVTWGAGTSFEGQVSMTAHTVCISMERMHKVLRLNEIDGDIEVEAGIRRNELDTYLQSTAFFFPAGPGVNASIGGMISTRASGIYAVRYGTMRENILALEVVLADGTIIKTGSRAHKSSAGYDLTHLFTGSEGTLGIITKATIRLHPKPEAVATAVFSFSDLTEAVNASVQIIQKRLPVACIELLDDVMISALNTFSSLDYPVQPTLFIEIHDEPAFIMQKMESIIGIAQLYGCFEIRTAYAQEEREQLWKARIDAAPAILAMRPGAFIMSTDVCVPVSQLAYCITEAKNDIIASGFVAPIIGHVGDGNFHAGILLDRENEIEVQKAKELNHKIVQRALVKEGTCTGEHGIGVGKLVYMQLEHGNALQIMKNIKKTVDPRNILNRGKTIPS